MLVVVGVTGMAVWIRLISAAEEHKASCITDSGVAVSAGGSVSDGWISSVGLAGSGASVVDAWVQLVSTSMIIIGTVKMRNNRFTL